MRLLAHFYGVFLHKGKHRFFLAALREALASSARVSLLPQTALPQTALLPATTSSHFTQATE